MERIHFKTNPAAYSGGAVVLRMPHQNYAYQMMMHQLSKQEALGNYYNKLQANINPAGMRAIDIPGWQQKVDQWEQFGMENRNAMVNPRLDGGRAQSLFNRMHAELLADVDKSKSAGQVEQAVRQVYLDPNKRRLATDQDMAIGHALSKSIYDPEHYKDNAGNQWGIEDFSFNSPPFDIDKQRKLLKAVTYGITPSKSIDPTKKQVITVNGVPQRIEIPWSTSYSPEQLKTIGDRTAENYSNDPSFQSLMDNKIHDLDSYNRLNEAGKKAYGPDFEIGTDPKKAAAAWGIMMNGEAKTGTDTWPYKNPPRPRTPTQREQQQQDMMDWINGTANAIKSGNQDEINRLTGVLYSGNGKRQFISASAGGSPTPGGPGGKGVTIHSYEPTWVPDDPNNPSGPGSKKDVRVDVELDPSDPNLINKLGNVYQQHMGSAPGMERVLLKNTVKGAASSPSTTPQTTPQNQPAVNPTDWLKANGFQ